MFKNLFGNTNTGVIGAINRFTGLGGSKQVASGPMSPYTPTQTPISTPASTPKTTQKYTAPVVVPPSLPQTPAPMAQQPMPQAPQPMPQPMPQPEAPFRVDTSKITSDTLTSNATANDIFGYQKQLQDSFNKYLQAQQPLQQQYLTQSAFSPEYQKAQQNLLALDLGYTQGLENIMNKPIGIDFQQGQAAALTRDTAIRQKAAAAVANYYENLRDNQLATTQAQMGFNTDQFNNQLALQNALLGYQQKQFEMNKPFVVGSGSSVFDPVTGQMVYQAPSTTEQLTPYQQFQATQSISKDVQKRTESAREISRQSRMILNSYNNILNGGDKSLNTQAIITSFNKILDPTSVVRESEYDRTAEGQSLLQRLQGKIDNIAKGGAGVTTQTLKEAVDIANTYLANAQRTIELENQRAVEMAQQFGLNPDFVGGTGISQSGSSGTSFAEVW